MTTIGLSSFVLRSDLTEQKWPQVAKDGEDLWN